MPGVGPKSAQRMAFRLLQEQREDARTLSRALEHALGAVTRCERCRMLAEGPLCMLCASAGRDEAQFLRWFDLMGVQRHLKVGGIFARLCHRDGKPGYLADIPRTLQYAVDSCARHADFGELGDLIGTRVLPAVIARLEGSVR